VSWLRDRFAPERKVIVVQGPDGAGKTTLLAQFVKAHSRQSFSFFVGADLWTSSSRQFLLEMCAQMSGVVGSKEKGVDDELSDNQLKQLFVTFYRRAAKGACRTKRPFYFVVDGLDWVTEGAGQESISDLLPTYPPDGIYLLTSSAVGQGFRFAHDPWRIQFFSPTETEVYLKDIGLGREEARRVYDACMGMPGYLAQIRREIQSGISIDEVLADLPKGFRELLEREWKRARIEEDRALDALAILAYSEMPLNVITLAQTMDDEEAVVRSCLTSAPMVQLESNGHAIRFVTDAHRQFVADKLRDRRGQAEATLIKYYERDPFNSLALVQLPILYKKTERYEALRHLVNAEYLTRTLRQERDLSLLRRNARLVADEAYKAEDWQTLSQYALISSILRTLSTRSVMETEIEALLALGDYPQSLEIAYKTVLPEDRLRLLAKVGSYLKQQGLPVPDEVLSDLEHMVAEIEPTGALREQVIEIAADLFYVHHQAAMELIEKVAGTDAEGKLLDVILAVLSVRMKGEADSTEVLRSRISDQSLRDFARASSPAVGELTPGQVLVEAGEISDTSGKLFLLRSWCNANRDNPASIKVIDRALEIITSSTDYSPSTRHLRQFAEPLIACKGDEVYRLVERLDLLKSTAIKRPAEELVRLELLLASVEAQACLDKATTRLYQTYLDLDDIPELDVRCYCLARILLSLPEIDPEDYGLRDEVEQQLIDEYQALLDGSADHLALTRRLLGALTNYKPEMAIGFANKLNTRERRDTAYREILRVYTDREPETINLSLIEEVLDRISESERRDWTLVRVLERFAKKDMFKRVPQARRFQDKISHISDPRNRSYAYARCLQMMASAGEAKAAEALFDKMVEAWSTIDQKWQQVHIGFDLVTIIAQSAPEFAEKLLESTRAERAITPLAEEVVAELYINTIKLAIRVFSDILKDQDYATDRDKLIEAIRHIPSCAVQSQLLADLALRHYLSGHQQDFEKLVKEGVLKTLEGCEDSESRAQTVVEIAPCLFQYERNLMKDEVSQLSPSRRDQALGQAVAYLLSGRPAADPIDLDSLNVQIEYPEARRACEVLEQMNGDSTTYYYLSCLVDTLVQQDPRSPEREKCILVEKNTLSIAKELKKIAEGRFPDPDNIRHKGYQIAAQASIARLRAAAAQRLPFRASEQWEKMAPSWPDIAQAAREIPNTADRALVMAWAGAEMYVSESNLACQLLEEAKECISKIPNIVDRADRLYHLAKAWNRADDRESAKVFLDEAMSILQAWNWDQTRDQVTGQILELAHSLDPEFAASLTSSVDNPTIEYGLRQDLATRDLQHQPDKIADREQDVEELQYILGQAAWRLLKSFCSGKGYAQQEKLIGKWAHLSVGADFDDTYRVMAWSIENSLARTERRQDPCLSDTYRGLLDSLQMIRLIGEALLSAEQRAKDMQRKNPALPTSLQIFPEGSHAEAVAFIREWLAENGGSYVKIYDPYFTAAELDILKFISPAIRVDILTSWKVQGMSAGDPAIEHRYRDAWNNISDQRPPETHIYISGIKSSGESPMHERYITTQGGGIQLGTSLSGLGRRDSYTRLLDADEVFCSTRSETKGGGN